MGQFKQNVGIKANFLIRIADIDYFEGPMLTLFTDARDRKLYLFQWADRLENFNRWLIYSVSPNHLFNYLWKRITYSELFTLAISKQYFYTDISGTPVVKNFKILPFDTFPEKYLPRENVFFEEDDCPDFEKLQSFVWNVIGNIHENHIKKSNLNLVKEQNFSQYANTNIQYSKLNAINQPRLFKTFQKPLKYA
jgi:hypothetical protein